MNRPTLKSMSTADMIEYRKALRPFLSEEELKKSDEWDRRWEEHSNNIKKILDPNYPFDKLREELK